MVRKKAENSMVLIDVGSHTNAPLTGKKWLAKIATKEQKPTVHCPCLMACYILLNTSLEPL